MLKFRQFLYEQFLILEDRLNKIKDIFKNKIDTSHDTLAQHKDSDAIVDHFATHADPSQNKAHTQWIVSRYRQGQFRQEDHPRIHEALSTFDKPSVKTALKAAKKPTDINQYKSLSDLEDAVEPHKEAISGKEKEKKIKSEGADLVHSGNGVTIHHIKTKGAACSYGAGTKWCTAGEKNNMFDHYNKEGPIFVIQHQGRKYQFHNDSYQFMDEKDNPTDISKVHPDIQKEMAKSEHPEIQKANIIFNNPHVTPEQITKALDDKDVIVRERAIQHSNVTPEQITKALDDKNAGVRDRAIKHPNVTPEHISKALNDNNRFVRQEAIKHPNVTPEHITKALNDEHHEVRWEAIRHPNVTPEHISKALNDKSVHTRELAIRRPNVTPEHISKALNDKDVSVREKAIRHPNVTPEHISKALNDPDYDVRYFAKKADESRRRLKGK